DGIFGVFLFQQCIFSLICDFLGSVSFLISVISLCARSGCGMWGITSVVFAPNGNLLATASMDKTIKLWDLNTEKLIYTITKHKNYIN
ncbi:hypothetical protein IQ227_10285, partial [Anabaena aphanizomenioides LEGE 00250]|nr:hypothetical protein [Sphaerospermopsis aphanizomenoides LEGE 00250]